MASLTTIPTQAGVEYVRVLLTMGAGTPSGASLNIVASQSYVTQTGDAQFYDSSLFLILNGIQPHQPGSSTGAVRLRNTGGSFSTWRNAQARTPLLKYASSADGDTVRQGSQGNVGNGYYNWHIAGLPSTAQVGVGDTINLVVYVPPAPSVAVLHDLAAALTLGVPGFSALVGKTAIATHDSAVSFALGAPSFSAVLGKFDVTLYDLVAGFELGAPTFSAVVGKTTLAEHDRAAGFALGAPAFAAVLGKTIVSANDRAASFALGAPSFSAVLGKLDVSDQDRAVAFALGVPLFSAVLGKRAVAEHNSAAAFTLGVPSFSAVLAARAIASHDRDALFTLGVPSFSAVLGLADATTQDREAAFVLGAPVFSIALGKTALGVHDIAASFALVGVPTFAVVLAKRIPADRTGPIAAQLTSGIATLKRTLLAGGLLRSIEWRRRTGERDVRGRQSVTTTLIDALIEQRPALDRDRIDTERTDDTVLTILDPVAIVDSDTFRWGDHTYKVAKIDGVIKNESTGVRFSSEVTVIR